MKKIFIVFILFLINLSAKELEITKYITNEKPKIIVEYQNLPIKLQKMLKIDAKIVAHYEIKIDKKIENLKGAIKLSNYKGFNYLLRLNYKNKHLTAFFYDLISHKSLLYKRYKIPNFNVYPFMIHSLSFDLNEQMGFDSVEWLKRKIVYSIYLGAKETDIFLADITLTYRKKIVSGGINIFPKWANKEQTEIYYTKFLKEPTLFRYNIYTGKKKRVLSSPGMLIVSDVKKDKLLLTLAINDQPDIYEFYINSRKLKRVTKFSGIDVNGHFYDNNKIVFISDRLGYPNVYQKDLETGMVSKLIHHGKNHISVSTNGDNVVVSSRETDKAFERNTFNLLLVNKNSDFVKRLTFGGKNMQPVFSNDGDTIIFIKEFKFNSKFGIIRLAENRVFYFKLNRKMQSFDY